jgi:hypothetical protein
MCLSDFDRQKLFFSFLFPGRGGLAGVLRRIREVPNPEIGFRPLSLIMVTNDHYKCGENCSKMRGRTPIPVL